MSDTVPWRWGHEQVQREQNSDYPNLDDLFLPDEPRSLEHWDECLLALYEYLQYEEHLSHAETRVYAFDLLQDPS